MAAPMKIGHQYQPSCDIVSSTTTADDDDDEIDVITVSPIKKQFVTSQDTAVPVKIDVNENKTANSTGSESPTSARGSSPDTGYVAGFPMGLMYPGLSYPSQPFGYATGLAPYGYTTGLSPPLMTMPYGPYSTMNTMNQPRIEDDRKSIDSGSDSSTAGIPSPVHSPTYKQPQIETVTAT